MEKEIPAPGITTNKKLQALETVKSNATGFVLTTNYRLKINDNQNPLKAGECGATLIDYFIL